MTGFFVDIWADLREKRLWPAAAALLAAIVAVPAVLFKPASDAAPPNVAAPHGSNGPTLPVVHVDGGPLMGSHLEAFRASEKNPFKPMKDLAKTSASSSGAAPTTPASNAGGASTPSSGAASGGSGGGSGSGGSSGSAGGSGGSTPSGGSGTTSGGGTTSHTTTTTQWFHYVADFSFGATGAKAKTYKGKAAYTLLPDEKTPVVVFLGISADHKTALFFLDDPGYDAQGEGTCIGTKSCQFVTLSLSESGNEENFSSVDGSKSYDLKLLKIRRESLGTGSQPAAPSTPSSSKKGKAVDATGAGVAAATNSTSEAALPAVFVDGPGLGLAQNK
jgi:hypothetical protein